MSSSNFANANNNGNANWNNASNSNYVRGYFLLEEIENISKDMCLFINHKKTHITKLKHGFTFLKTRYIITDSGKIIKKIPRDTITRERRKLKKFKRLLSENKITLKEIKDQYKSWKNNFKKFNCYKTIKNMDKLFNDLYKDINN